MINIKMSYQFTICLTLQFTTSPIASLLLQFTPIYDVQFAIYNLCTIQNFYFQFANKIFPNTWKQASTVITLFTIYIPKTLVLPLIDTTYQIVLIFHTLEVKTLKLQVVEGRTGAQDLFHNLRKKVITPTIHSQKSSSSAS